MATNRRKRSTPRQRQKYVEQFGRSGLSQAEFCRRAKLHPVTFSLWRRKLQPAAPMFAQVELSAPVPVADTGGLSPTPRSSPGFPGAAVLHLPGGSKLELALEGETAWAGLGVMLKILQTSRP
jgi:hypothetical protein